MVQGLKGKQCVSHNEVRVYFHDTLVDLRIPGAAMRAANFVLVKEPLTSRFSILHTQHTYAHSQVKYLNAHIRWVCAVLKPGKQTHTITINSGWYPVYVCVIPVTEICFSWHHCCYSFPGSQYFLHRGSVSCHQSGNFTSTFSSVIICQHLFGPGF